MFQRGDFGNGMIPVCAGNKILSEGFASMTFYPCLKQ